MLTRSDNTGRSLIFLGIRLHNFGAMYLMKCLPYDVVLNLGKTNSLFVREYQFGFCHMEELCNIFWTNVVFVHKNNHIL